MASRASRGWDGARATWLSHSGARIPGTCVRENAASPPTSAAASNARPPPQYHLQERAESRGLKQLKR